MRIQSLTVRTDPNEKSTYQKEAMRPWLEKTRPQRTPGWTWSDLSDGLVVEAVEAMIQDFKTDPMGVQKVMTSLLLARDPADRRWAWALPVDQGTEIVFEGKIGTRPEASEALSAVEIECVPESSEDRTRLEALGALNQSATVSPADLENLLESPSVSVTPTPARLSVSNLDVSLLAAEVKRVAAAWPEQDPVLQIMMVVGPLIQWQRAQDFNASETEVSLGGLTFEGVSCPEDMEASFLVRQVKSEARLRATAGLRP